MALDGLAVEGSAVDDLPGSAVDDLPVEDLPAVEGSAVDDLAVEGSAVDDLPVDDLPAVEGLAVEGLVSDAVVRLLAKLNINFRYMQVGITYRTWLSVFVSVVSFAAMYYHKLCCSKTKFEECPSVMKILSYREAGTLSAL